MGIQHSHNMNVYAVIPSDKNTTETELDASAQIALFNDFFEKNYYADILEKVRKEEKYLVVDFFFLTRFSQETADLLFDRPEEVLKWGEITFERIDEKTK